MKAEIEWKTGKPSYYGEYLATVDYGGDIGLIVDLAMYSEIGRSGKGRWNFPEKAGEILAWAELPKPFSVPKSRFIWKEDSK